MLRPHLRLQQFELQERIGIGGDGEVWRVRCSKGKEYALKARPINQHVKSFHKEFERLRTMRLPNIIHVHEMGMDKNYVYYTMDLIRGVHFQQAVQEEASIEKRILRCIQLSLQVSIALSSMHDAGLIHLDLKPGNIMVSNEDKVTLLDFGQACSLGDIQHQRSTAGTFAYMSPEQRIGHPTDQKTDCYALGICIYEAITGSCPTDIHSEGSQTSLVVYNPEIPLSLSHLVDSLLELDPNDRPTAFQAQEILLKLAYNLPVQSTTPWPNPPKYISEPDQISKLLAQSYIVYGPFGSGSRRMIKEARRQWYLQGYRSVSGYCKPLHVLLPIQQILNALFVPLSQEERRLLAGSDAKIFRHIAPNLPIVAPGNLRNVNDSAQAIADSFIRLLQRCSPIAIVIWDIHHADRRTFSIIQKICAKPISGVRIWMNTRTPTPILPNCSPPPWTAQKEKKLWTSLCPESVWESLSKGEFFIQGLPISPLHSCIQAWMAIKKWKDPEHSTEIDLSAFGSLGVLIPPFPKEVATLLCPHFSQLLQQNSIQEVDLPQETGYDFTDHVITLALSEQQEDAQKHRLAAQAWQRCTHNDFRHAMIAYHKLCAYEDPSRQIINALDFSITNNDYPQAHRWLRYIDSLGVDIHSFTIEHARAMLQLYHDVGRIEPKQFTLLESLIKSNTQKLQFAALSLANKAINNGVSKLLLQETQNLIEQLHSSHPQLALELYRTIALALLQQGQWEQGNQVCSIGVQYAMSLLSSVQGSLLRIIQEKKLLLQITQSAILAHSMQYNRAIEVCSDGLALSQEVHMERCTFGFLINSAICHLEQGSRAKSKKNINQCARQIRHGKPRADSRAYCALVQAQLATEAGEYERGFDKLDEAIALGQTLQDLSLLRQAWTLMLDTAVASGRSKEGKRAIRAYKNIPEQIDRDHWPAALAQWYWMTGDIEKALSTLNVQRKGYAQGRILAEQGRLLIIDGQLREAAALAYKLQKEAKKHGHKELVLYADIIRHTAEMSSDAKISPLLEACQETEWTALYLGSLHLDLIRRKLRKQPIEKARFRLQDRAHRMKHFLFCELSKEELWL